MNQTSQSPLHGTPQSHASGQGTSVTEALALWNEPESQARQALLDMVYDDLRRLARNSLGRRRAGHSLQPTELLHEAYIRLADRERPAWKDRAHFFAVSATVMRGILVDHVRAYQAGKRGGDALRVTWDETTAQGAERGTDLLLLDDALRTLASFDEQKSRIIELRFFAGLTLEETARVLKISTATVVNETRRARAWLYREMSGQASGGQASGSCVEVQHDA